MVIGHGILQTVSVCQPRHVGREHQARTSLYKHAGRAGVLHAPGHHFRRGNTDRVDQDRDFYITTAAFGVSPTPGVGERGFWNSAFADQPGSNNDGGIKDSVVDALVERLASAQDRESLTVAARALDRVLLWNQYIVPQWFRSTYTIAYWDMFGRPDTAPIYGLGFLDTWWIDPAKATRLNRDKP